MQACRDLSPILLIFLCLITACGKQKGSRTPFTKQSPRSLHLDELNSEELPLSFGIGYIRLDHSSSRLGNLEFLDQEGYSHEDFPAIPDVYNFQVSGSKLLYMRTDELIVNTGNLYLKSLDQSYSQQPLLISQASGFQFRLSNERVVYIDSDNALIFKSIQGDQLAFLPHSPDDDIRDLTVTENRVLFTAYQRRPLNYKLLHLLDSNGNPVPGNAPLPVHRNSELAAYPSRIICISPESSLLILDSNANPIPNYRPINGVESFYSNNNVIFVRLTGNQNMKLNMNGEFLDISESLNMIDLSQLLIGPSHFFVFEASGRHIDVLNSDGVNTSRINQDISGYPNTGFITSDRVANSKLMAFTQNQTLYLLTSDGIPLTNFLPIRGVSRVLALPQMMRN